MKKELFSISLAALSLAANAQTASWNGSGTTGNAWRSSNIGINVSNPLLALDISTAGTNGGISVTQTSSGFSSLRLFNSTTGGRNWSVVSTGAGNSEGAGHFGIFDYSGGGYRFFIQGTTGRVGIGTSSSAPNCMLHVLSDDSQTTNNPMQIGGYYIEPTAWAGYIKYASTTKLGAHAAIYGYDLNNTTPANGNLAHGIGVYGRAETTNIQTGNSSNVGVFGRALGGDDFNVGGVFYGGSTGALGGRVIAGSTPQGSGTGFGVWANASGSNAAAVYSNGDSYASGFYIGADAILQKNIKPLANALDQLKQLKSNTFTFNTDENSSMNLPADQQMGLNADDVQKVYPGLVREMKDISKQMQTGTPGNNKTFKSINYAGLVPLLIAGAQEQQKEVDALKNLVAVQQQQINDLLAKSSAATGIEQLNAPVAGFSMEQNIPNPFSTETVIKYTLPQSFTTAYLAVYDLTGKQMTTLPVTSAASSVTITSEKLSAGIYIYSIIADGKVMDSKRMIVADKK